MKERAVLREKITILKYESVKLSEKENQSMGSSLKAMINWTANLKIEKYNNNESYKKGIPDDITYVKGNTATYKGLFVLWNLVMGKSPSNPIVYEEGQEEMGVYPLNNDNTYIAVGNGTATPSPDDTQLDAQTSGGTVNVDYYYKNCDDDYPVVLLSNPNCLQIRATFGSEMANFEWNEWGVANGDPDSPGDSRDPETVVLFNRRKDPMGRKEQGATWVIVADLIISPSAQSQS